MSTKTKTETVTASRAEFISLVTVHAQFAANQCEYATNHGDGKGYAEVVFSTPTNHTRVAWRPMQTAHFDVTDSKIDRVTVSAGARASFKF